MKTYGEVIEAVELGRLHDGVEHGLHDEADVVHDLVFGNVKTHKSLQETDKHNEEEQKEDERLAEHDLEDNEHGTEEAESIEIEEQAHPEHRRCERQEVVAELVEASALLVTWFMADRDHAEYKGYCQESVEGAVEHVPEGYVEATDLPELVDFVADKA